MFSSIKCRKLRRDAYKFIRSFWDVIPLTIIHSVIFLSMYFRLKVLDLVEIVVGQAWTSRTHLFTSLIAKQSFVISSQFGEAYIIFWLLHNRKFTKSINTVPDDTLASSVDMSHGTN